MNGLFSSLPKNLASALAPVARWVESLDWAVDLYSGLFASHDDYDGDSPHNLLHWFGAGGDGLPRGWFKRQFLPQFADRLAIDEMSYYLGFDSTRVSPTLLERHFSVDGLGPTPKLFNAIEQWNMLYFMQVDVGWWEAYTANTEILEQLQCRWKGLVVDSKRWDGGDITRPGETKVT